MKLAYVSLVRLPTDRAHGYAMMKMCEHFAARGLDVELVVPTRRHGIKDDPFHYYGIERNFTIRKLWATDFLGRFYKSRLSFFIDQLTFLLSLLRQRFGNTMVYARDYQVALFVRSKNITLEVHTIPHRVWLFSLALSRARRIVVISGGLKKALIALGAPEHKILVAPDAVDLSEFDITPSREVWREHGVDPQKKIVLYTGHFYGWKGAETLAKAAAALEGDAEVVLMGGIDEELASFKKEYAGPHVYVIGFQPRKNIPNFLMSADALVLPNSAKPKISSLYTSPLKLFQYMASSVPIVASDLPSIREILTDETAFWFAPDDENALARQIEYVLAHRRSS